MILYAGSAVYPMLAALFSVTKRVAVTVFIGFQL